MLYIIKYYNTAIDSEFIFNKYLEFSINVYIFAKLINLRRLRVC